MHVREEEPPSTSSKDPRTVFARSFLRVPSKRPSPSSTVSKKSFVRGRSTKPGAGEGRKVDGTEGKVGKEDASRVQASLDIKLLAIAIWESGQKVAKGKTSYSDVANELRKKGHGTWSKMAVSNWLRDKEKLKEAGETLTHSQAQKRKKISYPTTYPELEAALSAWHDDQQERDLPTPGPAIKVAAQEIFRSIKFYACETEEGRRREDLKHVRETWPEEFDLGESWVEAFKRQYGIFKI